VNESTVLRILRRALLCLLLPAAASAHAEDKLMLIVGANSHVTGLTSVEVHKLFLGLTVLSDERRLRAVRNESDERMRQVFFQNIVSMSESAYDRRLLSLTIQEGRSALPVLRTPKQVFDALAEDPDAVSFAWASDVAKEPRVKALRVLWNP